MIKKSISALLSLFMVVLVTSCGQDKAVAEPSVQPTERVEASEVNNSEPHSYGGWYCPDNLGGFPPVDIQALSEVPVVTDRLPTQEETRNGTSLIFVDQEKYPDAKPFQMELPRVARIYSAHSNMNELVVVIQAVVVGSDTVVGFRYPNGGNGSAWYREVSFLSDEEVADIGPAPMVYEKTIVTGSKPSIWKTFAKTSYAKELAVKFDKTEFFESEWTDNSQVHLNLEADGVKASGVVANVWGTLYLQVDYDYNGFFYSEKFMAFEQPDGNTEIHWVSGPYPADFALQENKWKRFIAEIATKSGNN